jgi:hypothetical protein
MQLQEINEIYIQKQKIIDKKLRVQIDFSSLLLHIITYGYSELLDMLNSISKVVRQTKNECKIKEGTFFNLVYNLVTKVFLLICWFIVFVVFMSTIWVVILVLLYEFIIDSLFYVKTSIVDFPPISNESGYKIVTQRGPLTEAEIIDLQKLDNQLFSKFSEISSTEIVAECKYFPDLIPNLNHQTRLSMRLYARNNQQLSILNRELQEYYLLVMKPKNGNLT